MPLDEVKNTLKNGLSLFKQKLNIGTPSANRNAPLTVQQPTPSVQPNSAHRQGQFINLPALTRTYLPVSPQPGPAPIVTTRRLSDNNNNNNAVAPPGPKGMPQVSKYHNASKDEVDPVPDEATAKILGVFTREDELKVYEEFIALEELMNAPDSTATPFAGKNEKRQYFAVPLKGGQYRIERQDEKTIANPRGDGRIKNPSGFLLEKLIARYRTNVHFFGEKRGFTEWLRSLTDDDFRVIWPTGGDDKHLDEILRRFQQGVRMLPDVKAPNYSVRFRGGRLHWNRWKAMAGAEGLAEPLDTTGSRFHNKKTGNTPRHVYAERNAAIFVCSKDEKFFTHPFRLYRFHHSSFTRGDDVIFAGEWEVKSGSLVWISGQSGHYKPTFPSLLNCIEILAAKGVMMDTYDVKFTTGNPVPALDVFKNPELYERLALG